MPEPLLTIAIPTYKRPKNLEAILEQLKDQCGSAVALLISNDCPDESTNISNLVEKYRPFISNLVLNNNGSNLGYSGNVCKLYELATTRYIWFLCDDDTVLPNAVKKIITKLEKYSPAVGIFNYSWVDSYGVPGEAGVKEDTPYLSKEIVQDYNVLMRFTFLSNLIMERIVPVQEIKSKNYVDNVFFQITLGLQILSNKMSLYEFPDTILHRNVGFKYGEFFKFYMLDHLKAVTIIEHIFDNSKFISWSKKHVPTAFKLYMSQKIGLFVYKGEPTTETIENIFKYYGPLLSKILLSFPFILRVTPTLIIKVAYFISLVSKHGLKGAISVYKSYVNRAFTDERKTSFTEYK